MELHIRAVSKTYPNGVHALKDVTLTIPVGMYGLLGPNGAGKSTLMRIVATLQEADEGSICLAPSGPRPSDDLRVAMRDVEEREPLGRPEHRGAPASEQEIDVLRQKDQVRETLGYLPQSFGFHPRVSAERLLDHFAVLKGVVERGPRREVVESLLRRTNLWEVRKQRVGTAQLRGAHVRGRAVLSETLSNYSAMMVTEKVLGPDEARRVYDFQMDRYLSRRQAFERDVPLVEVEDHPHIAYGKGAVAMYTLREHIGEEAVNTALRRLLEQYRPLDSRDRAPDEDRLYPTALDLVRELRAVTPESLQYLVTDLFETITLWDVKTEEAAISRTNDGQYEVTLDVVARKMRADGIGHETETPMDDFVEIGVFAADDGNASTSQGESSLGPGLGKPLYLERHRIRSGAQTIRITLPAPPSRAGIDPWHKLIDRDRDDNVIEVKAETDSVGAGS